MQIIGSASAHTHWQPGATSLPREARPDDAAMRAIQPFRPREQGVAHVHRREVLPGHSGGRADVVVAGRAGVSPSGYDLAPVDGLSVEGLHDEPGAEAWAHLIG